MAKPNVQRLTDAGVFDFSQANTEQKRAVNEDWSNVEVAMLIAAKAQLQAAYPSETLGPIQITPTFF